MIENKTPLSSPEDQATDAEGETLQDQNKLQNSQPDSVEAAGEGKTKGHTGRKLVVTLLVVLGCLILVLASVTFWARYTLLNTNGWVNAVGPIPQDPIVAQNFSAFLAGELFEEVNVDQAMTEMLPPNFQMLGAPLSKALQGLVQDTIASLIQSDGFNTVWVGVNRAAHSVIVGVLRGEGDLVYLQSGQLVIDFSDLITFIQNNFGLERIDLAGENDGRIVLLESQQVAYLQEAIHYLDTFGLLLPILSLVVFVSAWFVSLWRRKTLLWIGIAVAITMLLSLIAYEFIQSGIFISIADPLARLIGRESWDVVTAGLVTLTIVLLIVGILIAVGAWLAGPNTKAVAFRSWTQERVSDLRSRRD
ncbi:MAG: hypothetical protein MUO67_20490 [Anaerolineales bacterium]|nr:hypothetical protein [Anaerolineales bacterium]